MYTYQVLIAMIYTFYKKTYISRQILFSEGPSSGFGILDHSSRPSRHRQTSQVPCARARGSTPAVDFNPMGTTVDRDGIGAGECYTLDDDSSSRSTQCRRITLVNYHSILSGPTSFVVAVNDILDRRSGSSGVSLDPKRLDVIGDGVPRDSDSIDSHPRGDGTDGNTMSTSAGVIGESDVSSPVDSQAIILIYDRISSDHYIVRCNVKTIGICSSRFTTRPGIGGGSSRVIDCDAGERQGASINCNGSGWGIDNFEVFKGPGDANAHHGIRLGHAAAFTQAVPVLITISDELVSIPIECHRSSFQREQRAGPLLESKSYGSSQAD